MAERRNGALEGSKPGRALRVESSAILSRLDRLPAVNVVHAGRVAEFLAEVGKHRLQHARIDGSRRVVVEIDRTVGRRHDLILTRQRSVALARGGCGNRKDPNRRGIRHLATISLRIPDLAGIRVR
jgi:hypothetical protein